MSTTSLRLGTAVLGATVLTSAAGLAAEGARRVEVTGPGFVVLSDAGVETAASVARELERIRLFFMEAMPAASVSPQPVRVYALESGESLARLLPEYGDAAPPGLFRSAFGRDEILVKTSARSERPHGVLYHEYFHVVSRPDAPGMPVWLSEGLAELWGQIEISEARAEVGRPVRHYLELLRTETLLPWATLLDADRGSPHYRDPAKRGIFYAQSWLLTHYLMLADARRHRGELARYLAALERGEGPKEAWRRIFGDPSALEDRLSSYARQDRFPTLRIDPPAESFGAELAVRELSEAEWAAAQADFLVWGPSYREAEPLARRAFELAPELPLAKEVLGALELQQRRWRDAWRWFAEAAVASGASHMAHFYAATLAPPEERFDVEASLLRAIETRPSFSPAYVELAYHYAGLDATLERALAMTERAAELSPGSGWHRSLVARVLRAMGRARDARRSMRKAVRLALASGRAEDANLLCRYGSLAGMAETVLPACNRAVELGRGEASYRDSRAVARSILGDREGAVADLRAFLAYGADELSLEATAQRRAWIRRLEEGDNPFDARTRGELLGRPF